MTCARRIFTVELEAWIQAPLGAGLVVQCRAFRLSVLLPHFSDVGHGLGVRGNIFVLGHRFLARVVGCDRQPIVLECVLQEF